MLDLAVLVLACLFSLLVSGAVLAKVQAERTGAGEELLRRVRDLEGKVNNLLELVIAHETKLDRLERPATWGMIATTAPSYTFDKMSLIEAPPPGGHHAGPDRDQT